MSPSHVAGLAWFTSSQSLSTGAFLWQTKATTSSIEMNGLVGGLPARSVDGTVWVHSLMGIFHFGLTAITVPEPRVSILMLVGTIFAIRPRLRRI